MRVTVDEEGKTRVMERYLVSAPLSGRLRRIDLEPGDPVRAGQTVLASIDPADPALLDVRSRAEGEARVQAAEAARRLASADLEKAKVAELQAASARQSVEAAASALQVAEFELEMARAALLHTQQAGASRSFIVRSPIDGAVLRVFQESGGVVAAGTPLLEVADPRRLEIIVDLLSADAVKVQPGIEVVVENWGGEKALRARVRRVEPSGFTKVSALGVEEQRVNVVIDLVDPPGTWGSLGDGYRVETRIVIWEKEDAIKVPASAVFSRGEGFSVFVVSGGRARLRPVQIGKRNGLEAEAVDGLLENETVVLHPSDKVADGVKVAAHAP
jgi:HlyD family secretion protein